MNSNKKLIMPLLIASLTLLSLISNGQGKICKGTYNYALNFYNKGQFENINNYLINGVSKGENGCFEDINSTKDYYRNNQDGISTIFKVYKLSINSYRNLDQEGLARKKMEELVAFFENKFSREVVEKKLHEAQLTPIDY